MWEGGGRFYWARKKSEKIGGGGVVVVFTWISSQEQEIEPFVDLYASLGWNSLVCYPEIPNPFAQEKVTGLAFAVLSVLLKELKIRPLPIVFAAFSDGSKACLYKVLQNEYQLIGDCIAGQIYDSSPLDITGDSRSQPVHHPFIKTPQPPCVLSWVTRAIASGLDALFPNRLDVQRAEYWQTLCTLANIPHVIFCSKTDSLASHQVICKFAQCLQDLGCDITLMKCNGSPHIGHYRHYPDDYKAAVSDSFEKATTAFAQRVYQPSGERLNMGGTSDRISESVCNLYKAAVSSNQSLRRVAIDPTDHFLPSLEESRENKDVGSVQDSPKDQSIQLQDQTRISAHSVLGQVLFDVCVPKNIEDWDLKAVGPLNRNAYGSSRGNSPNLMKFIRRSRR